ncbi:MAG: FKBP-type peptidyl-prolyl cis-trans isomerase [Thermodesulfobacteriota bacterium]
MSVAKAGDFVQVFYTGSLTNGEVFDSNEGGRALEFQLGLGQVIDGFDRAVTGMSVGEAKKVTLPPEQAYGEADSRLIMEIPLSQVPAGMQIEVGMTLELTARDGQPMPARVTALGETSMTLDLNSPLAGETLVFDIRLAGISDAPTQAAGCGCGCGHESDGGCSC